MSPWLHYSCSYCGHVFEVFRQWTGKEEELKCPKCQDEHVVLLPQENWDTDVFGYDKKPPKEKPA